MNVHFGVFILVARLVFYGKFNVHKIFSTPKIVHRCKYALWQKMPDA
jgi:hypothetical protein